MNATTAILGRPGQPIAACAAAALAVFVAQAAPAATYFVRLSGNDGASGLTAASAWRTIARAASSAGPGDVIFVGAGTYSESITFTRDGIAGNPIRFVADVTGAQTGDAGDVNVTPSSSVVWTLSAANYNTLTGFRFPSGATALQIDGSAGVVVQNCVINGTTGHAMTINSASSVIISGCNISGNGSRGVYLLSAGDCTIADCTIQSNSLSGILAESSSSALTIRSCRIISNGGNGVTLRQANALIINCELRSQSQNGVYADSSNVGRSVQIWHCSIAGNAVDGVRIDAGSMSVTNCIIANSTDDGLDVDGGTLTHTYNIVYNNGGGSYEGTTTGTGESATNPQFVSTTDLHLASASPAINAGTSGAAVTTQDLDGRSRPAGGGWDPGCYEWSIGLFTDVSATAGFNLQTTNSADLGSGLHWGDLDNDGDLDVIITGSTSKLLANNNDGTFFASAFGGGSVRRQGALLDIDNDGDLDFWAVAVGDIDSERLFRNNGAGAFSNIGDLGLTTPSTNEAVSATDINWDGWCDIVMFSASGNYVGVNQASSTLALAGSSAAVYGLGDFGDWGNGDYCAAGDANNDGRTDFFYHYGSGKLFLSEGDGTYIRSSSAISVVTGETEKIGSAWADYDNDGDTDLFVPRLAVGYPSYLWQNNAGAFTNVAYYTGLNDSGAHRSGCWGDYDNDGDLDLYIVTASGGNLLYRNDGISGFVLMSENASAAGDNQDAVFVDYDNDGDLDLAVTRRNTTNVLLRNNLNNSNYLRVRVIGFGDSATNKAALGVRVELYNAAGTTLLGRRFVGMARGFAGEEPLWLHFGGVNPATAYLLKVHFVSSTMSVPVTPNLASTVIGTRTLPQTVTVIEPPPAKKITGWTEVDPMRP